MDKLKCDDNKIVLNDYIENDPLSEENLDKTLEFTNKIRLSCPNKTIWLYSGFCYEDIWFGHIHNQNLKLCKQEENHNAQKRYVVLKNVDVFVDGQYMDSQKDITLKFRGSRNQRCIDVKKTLELNKVILYCD